MKITQSTGILLAVVLITNIGVSAYLISNLNDQNLTARNSLDEKYSIITEAQKTRLNTLTERLVKITNVLESEYGYISDLPSIQLSPVNSSLGNRLVKIGFLPATSDQYDLFVPYVNEIVEPAMNELAWRLGSDLVFDFEIQNSQGQAAIHLGEVQKLKAQGIDLFIGGLWSSHACASISYCNDNDMLMFSPSSTTPTCAFHDNFFRLSVTDPKQSVAIHKMLESKGLESVIILARGDAWADNIYDLLKGPLSQSDIETKYIRYAGEATEFTEYLAEAEQYANAAVKEHGGENVGVLLISFSESVEILHETKNYSTLYNLTWFGSDGTVKSQKIIDGAPEEAAHVKLYSPYIVSPDTKSYSELSALYSNLTGADLTYAAASIYDISMVLVTSIIAADSLDPLILRTMVPEISAGYIGVSGLCTLDENGDRATSNYGIYSYSYIDGELGSLEVGMYSYNGEITWYEEFH